MTLLSLQAAPDAWWSAFLSALQKDAMLEEAQVTFARRFSDGFMTKE